VEFATFAVPTILGELKRYFRDFGWAVHVSRGEKDRAMRVLRTDEQLSRRLGRSATAAQVAGAAGLSVEQVLDARETAFAARPTSLDARTSEGAQDDCDHLVDRLPADQDDFELVESRDRVARCLRGLSPREREVLYLRFVADLTQAQIGARIGVSQMQVSRILRRALEHSRALADGSARRG
jgi:RNA polymerase sigma-B factor